MSQLRSLLAMSGAHDHEIIISVNGTDTPAFCRRRRKIKFEDNPTEWKHHRGGWTYAFHALDDLYAQDGVLCVSAVEEWPCDWKVIEEPWVGFVHQAPRNNDFYYPDLERLVQNQFFIKSLEKCHGLFVLSHVVKEYLQNHLKIPIAQLLYPISPFPDSKAFNWEKYESDERKKVLFIGEFLRNYQAFHDLIVPPGYQKYLLKSPDVNFDQIYNLNKERVQLKVDDGVTIRDRVADDEYDELLSSSIVFLSLYDAPANTTVVECLARNTPLVVNRLPGIEEYLGSDYPLFYDTMKEATQMIGDREKLLQASQYLKSLPIKSKLTRKHFLQSFIKSSIYRSLPLPPSQKGDAQQTKFPQFDVTVVICCYKRVYNLKSQLECFKKQDYTGSFEMILWNNNLDTQSEVAAIASPYMKELNIRCIQSSENYYCIIRLATAHLMRSNMMLICDDDVIPSSRYISSFMSKFAEYGPRAVLGCRGHVFTQHTLNEEEPHRIWDEYEHLRFFSETEPDRQVCGVVSFWWLHKPLIVYKYKLHSKMLTEFSFADLLTSRFYLHGSQGSRHEVT